MQKVNIIVSSYMATAIHNSNKKSLRIVNSSIVQWKTCPLQLQLDPSFAVLKFLVIEKCVHSASVCLKDITDNNNLLHIQIPAVLILHNISNLCMMFG